ncbi:MAG: Gfo/Idh/MocA family oxidoreductase [Candidatus Bathyarchaeia archaeon]
MNVGLIGCGGIANLHLKALKSIKGVNIVGVCDLNLKKAKEIAYKFKVKKFFQDYNDLFEIKDLELVDICTPISTHAQIVCDAARVVPAILVEKPMALNVAQCDEMIKEIKKHNSKLCVSHQQIFLPSVEKAKSLIESGKFDLISFTTKQKENFERLKAKGLAADWMVAPEQGGIIWEVCCHLAYLQLHFLPDINEVYAVGRAFKYSVYDNFAVLLRTSAQRYGIIDLSWTTDETEIVYEMIDASGKKAQIYRDFDYFIENCTPPPLSISGVMSGFLSDQKRTLQKWAKFGLNYMRKRKVFPHFKLFCNYITSIKKDLPPPIAPEDGRKTVYLLEQIKKSLDERRPIKF